MALKPGKVVLNMIRNVMQGKDEGADNSGNNDEDETSERVSIGVAGRVSWIEGCVLFNMWMVYCTWTDGHSQQHI